MRNPSDPHPEDEPAGGKGPTAEDRTPAIPITRYDLKILQGLRKIIRAVDIHSRKLVATHDITGPQLICLTIIVEDGPLTLKQVAERAFLSPSTVVGILDRLSSKGLVLRTRDSRDRRLVNVTATAPGHELVKNAPSPLQEGLAQALNDLPEIEQATIALSLQRIVDLMEAESLDASPVLDTGTTLTDKAGESSARRADAPGTTPNTKKGS